MRVRVWINPNTPLLANCMAKRDDGVLSWVEFIYERVYKVCKRCGVIGHSALHRTFSNPNIERMINEQIEKIHRRFEYVTSYDL
ncbi:hypothetical protein CRYUN_Cryun05aG0130000 [Craigia yunnanensis]